MFIIPFYYSQSSPIHIITMLTIGGETIWSEDDSYSIEDILEPNGIYVTRSIKEESVWLCEVDITKTKIDDFYQWTDIDDHSLFCWRTFYVFDSLSISNDTMKEIGWTYRRILEHVMKHI
jgi:hypothetical protein